MDVRERRLREHCVCSYWKTSVKRRSCSLISAEVVIDYCIFALIVSLVFWVAGAGTNKKALCIFSIFASSPIIVFPVFFVLTCPAATTYTVEQPKGFRRPAPCCPEMHSRCIWICMSDKVPRGGRRPLFLPFNENKDVFSITKKWPALLARLIAYDLPVSRLLCLLSRGFHTLRLPRFVMSTASPFLMGCR